MHCLPSLPFAAEFRRGRCICWCWPVIDGNRRRRNAERALHCFEAEESAFGENSTGWGCRRGRCRYGDQKEERQRPAADTARSCHRTLEILCRDLVVRRRSDRSDQSASVLSGYVVSPMPGIVAVIVAMAIALVVGGRLEVLVANGAPRCSTTKSLPLPRAMVLLAGTGMDDHGSTCDPSGRKTWNDSHPLNNARRCLRKHDTADVARPFLDEDPRLLSFRLARSALDAKSP